MSEGHLSQREWGSRLLEHVPAFWKQELCESFFPPFKADVACHHLGWHVFMTDLVTHVCGGKKFGFSVASTQIYTTSILKSIFDTTLQVWQVSSGHVMQNPQKIDPSFRIIGGFCTNKQVKLRLTTTSLEKTSLSKTGLSNCLKCWNWLILLDLL